MLRGRAMSHDRASVENSHRWNEDMRSAEWIHDAREVVKGARVSL